MNFNKRKFIAVNKDMSSLKKIPASFDHKNEFFCQFLNLKKNNKILDTSWHSIRQVRLQIFIKMIYGWLIT